MVIDLQSYLIINKPEFLYCFIALLLYGYYLAMSLTLSLVTFYQVDIGSSNKNFQNKEKQFSILIIVEILNLPVLRLDHCYVKARPS